MLCTPVCPSNMLYFCLFTEAVLDDDLDQASISDHLSMISEEEAFSQGQAIVPLVPDVGDDVPSPDLIIRHLW